MCITTAPNANCDAASIAAGAAVVGGIGALSGLIADATAPTAAEMLTSQTAALDKIIESMVFTLNISTMKQNLSNWMRLQSY